jgi:hypothetical protein
MDLADLLFGSLAGAVASHAAGVVSQTVQKTPLDELLASAHEKSLYPYPYAELTALRLVPSRLFHSKVILQRRDGRKITFWGARKDLLAAIEAATQLKSQGVPVEVR